MNGVVTEWVEAASPRSRTPGKECLHTQLAAATKQRSLHKPDDAWLSRGVADCHTVTQRHGEDLFKPLHLTSTRFVPVLDYGIAFLSVAAIEDATTVSPTGRVAQ